MLRSQSISNLQEKKPGLFGSFRKRSVNDLHKLVSEPKQEARKPLATMNRTSDEKLNRQRRTDEKLNRPRDEKLKRPSSKSEMTLRSTASTPNMNRLSTVSTSSSTSRSSVTTRSNASIQRSINIPVSNRLSKRSSILIPSLLDKTPTQYLTTHEDVDEVDMNYELPSPTIDSFLDYSPVTPNSIGSTDLLMDQTSIQFHDFETAPIDYTTREDFEHFDDYDFVSLDKTSTSNKHKSSASIGSATSRTAPLEVSVTSKLPIVNRKSLDFERMELSLLTEVLNAENSLFESKVSLLGNVVMVTTTNDSNRIPNQFEIDFQSAFDDPYDTSLMSL